MSSPVEPADRGADPSKPALIKSGGNVDAEAVRDAAELEAEKGEDDGLRRVTFQLSRDLNKRLDKYLTDRIPFMSRTQLQRLISEGGVLVNDRRPKASTALRRGDRVEVVVPPPPSSEIQPEEIPIDVLFEDEHVLVLNKTPDIIVHPARSHLSGTLVNALAWHFKHASDAGGALSTVGTEHARPGVVHRLDRKTSGVIVFAKTDEAHWKIGRQFEKRTVEKRYLAVVHGSMEPIAGVIDLPLGPHTSTMKGLREKYIVRHDDLGKASLTFYRAREQYEGFTLVELELRTGRTHQIRVHLSHSGWPIVGDDMYGGRAVSLADLGGEGEGAAGDVVIERQALHAALLSFTHPVSGERMTFSAPLREDMARLVQLLRAGRPGAGPTGLDKSTLDLSKIIPETNDET